MNSLLDCGGNDTQEVKDMLKKENNYNANATLAELDNTNTIVISHWYAEMPEFTMNYARFLEFLDAWKAVYDKDPDTITITMDPSHDLFTIEAT